MHARAPRARTHNPGVRAGSRTRPRAHTHSLEGARPTHAHSGPRARIAHSQANTPAHKRTRKLGRAALVHARARACLPGGFTTLVGGPEHLHTILPPLEGTPRRATAPRRQAPAMRRCSRSAACQRQERWAANAACHRHVRCRHAPSLLAAPPGLASVEEAMVREKVVESLNTIARGMSAAGAASLRHATYASWSAQHAAYSMRLDLLRTMGASATRRAARERRHRHVDVHLLVSGMLQHDGCPRRCDAGSALWAQRAASQTPDNAVATRRAQQASIAPAALRGCHGATKNAPPSAFAGLCRK
jgi:hypothetical protein